MTSATRCPSCGPKPNGGVYCPDCGAVLLHGPSTATVEVEVSDETRRRLRWIAERLDCTESAALEVVLDNWFGGSDVKT